MIVICMTYLVTLGEFPHVVVSSVEGIFPVAGGMLSWSGFFSSLLPTVIGNTVGGVLLVEFFNHAQVVIEESGEEGSK